MNEPLPQIFLMVPTFQPNDAVGNDVIGMYNMLREAGYPTRIFAEHIHPAVSSMATKAQVEGDQFWGDSRAILIYHHAINWALGEQILTRSANKIVIKYHNVTPAEYYKGYVEFYYSSCMEGREATRRLAHLRVDRIWGDSQFNADEFLHLGVSPERCRVSPPIHHIEEFAQAPFDSVITGAYRGAIPNILFVGAFRPNKGHAKAIEAFAAYRELSGQPARLFFVGSFDALLAGYVEELKQYAKTLGVDDSLFLAQSVSQSQLRAYYSIASVFLCTSEHEGFCVPLAEAMFFRVPIVAWATTAVGETCDGCGLVYQNFDVATFARAIDECVENPQTARRLARLGRARYESQFSLAAIRAQLLKLVDEVHRL